MANWQMACNRVTWACGCTSWQQWESGAWVTRHSRHWLCHRHETA